MENKSYNQSKMLLALSMIIFGTIGIFRKYIPLPSSVLALDRGIVGMLFLIVFAHIKGNKIDISAVKANLVPLLLSGVCLGFNWILLFEAYQYTTVATATLCYYMAPVIVILVSPIFFKEQLTMKKIACVIVAVIGMFFVSGVHKTGIGSLKEMKGILLGLLAAVLYAGVILFNKKIKEISVYDKTIIQLGTAAITLLPYTVFTENISELEFTPLIVVMLIVVGILHTGIAYALYFGSMKSLKAQTIALFSYIDPVIAIILSALVLQEGIGIEGIGGACLVLGATLLSELV